MGGEEEVAIRVANVETGHLMRAVSKADLVRGDDAHWFGGWLPDTHSAETLQGGTAGHCQICV